MTKQHCFLQVNIGDKPAGKIWIELFDEIVPKTCHNFRSLCNGFDVNGEQVSFKTVKFHRVIKGFMIQGGDTDHMDGRGGKSVYGEKFEDENFDLKHDCPGLLSMANAGPNTNGSQFFITTVPTPHLDGKHVVFGKVIKGMNVVRRIENMKTEASDAPIEPVVIADCGEGDGHQDVVTAADGDVYEDYPEDMALSEDDETRIKTLLEAAHLLKSIGNNYFSQKNMDMAIEKYEKAIRYLDAIHPSPEDLTEMSLAQKKDFFKLKLSCLLNASMIASKNNKGEEAVEYASKAHAIHEKLSVKSDLTLDNAEVCKIFYRRGQGYLLLKDYEQAKKDFAVAHQLNQEDKAIQVGLANVKKLIEHEKAKERDLYKRMFA